jgi:hypothetical protein
MQVLQRTQQLGRVKPAPRLVKLAFSLQVVKQFAAIDKRQDEIQLFFALERKLEGDNEWTVDLREHGPFGEGVRDFGSGDDVCFA